jgi:hypothetical protein
MTTPEQARQLVIELRKSVNNSHLYWQGKVADCIENLLDAIALKDQKLSVYIEIAKVLDNTGTAQALKAIREAMNADIGIDYKSPGNAR